MINLAGSSECSPNKRVAISFFLMVSNRVGEIKIDLCVIEVGLFSNCSTCIGLTTDLACRGSVAVALSAGGQRWLAAVGCWGERQESSRRACSPAGTRQDRFPLPTGRLLCIAHLCDVLMTGRLLRGVKKLRGADLDLLLEEVNLVLLLDQLLLLFGDLEQDIFVSVFAIIMEPQYTVGSYTVASPLKLHHQILQCSLQT